MRTPPRSVLIIVTRRIGDVLLATPLMRSIKRAWPETALDVLVFEGTQGVIAANPDLRRILTVPERPGWLAHLAFTLKLLRHYDLALSALRGDRPTFYAFIAGRWRAGLLDARRSERWKRLLLHHWAPFDDLNTHTVRMCLALAAQLGVPAHGEVAVTWSDDDAAQVDRLLSGTPMRPIALLHPYPKFNYKMWHHRGWIEIARWLAGRGQTIVLSGGGEKPELEYVAELAREMPEGTVNAAGKLTLGASACLASRARVYVGPDTAMTHIAAALGVPTVALFGPSNTVKWGPWPRGHAIESNPWRRCGSQQVSNVILVQGAAACAPCMLEGCGRTIASFSDCLQHLPASRVMAAINQALGGEPRG
ncbi:MAG: glycosyltransferase family 9 protein [Betaproteobacteria bacterium]|nr:glycosyltransferase family 9 protein [Betaproteobacteria bacterium]